MKTQYSLVAALLLLSAFFTSCEKFETDSRNQFAGRYQVEEYSQYSYTPSVYQVRIARVSVSEDEVRISNFYNVGIDVIGVVVGSRLYIPEQTIGNFTVEGQGALSGNTISLEYFVHAVIGGSTFDDNVEAMLVKMP
jgi:hypothetical protein